MDEHRIRAKIAAAQMRGKKMELNKLLGDLFETGIVPDSKRNRFIVNLILLCLTVAINFIKTDDVSVL